MPRHQQVTSCRRGGGPVSKMCPCEHCSLAVCEVCGGAEGTLTTDCPGTMVDHDRQQEVYETNLDYTDERGWHLVQSGELQVKQRYGETIVRRSPRFESIRLPPEPPHVDPRTAAAPAIDWAVVDRTANLQHELTLKAVAWVLADRVADDHSATCTRLEDEIDKQLPGLAGASRFDRARRAAHDADTGIRAIRDAPEVHTRDLLKQLEHEKIGFHLASQRAEKCDDEFRQAARKLVAALEEASPVLPTTPKKIGMKSNPMTPKEALEVGIREISAYRGAAIERAVHGAIGAATALANVGLISLDDASDWCATARKTGEAQKDPAT